MRIRSSTGRGLLAVGLLLLFYVGMIGLALGLLSLPYVLQVGPRLHTLLTVLCVAAGGAVLWSLVPRLERFEPPGLLLTEAEHPRLFEVIRDVARRMGARMPEDLYLIADVNAYVSQVGGVLGLGGRRVMCLGMGLLAVDNVSQLRAAVAHELGHFQGGDTRLMGVLCATRQAMARSLELFGRDEHALLRWPLAWMCGTFLRLTQALSREQELVADGWSVRIAGKRAHVSGLRWEALHAAGYRRFLEQEVWPLAHRGVVPDNLFEGYRRYLASAAWRESLGELTAAASERAPCPYDSHPSLDERVAFAERFDLPDVPVDPTPASTLLSNLEALERCFTQRLWPHAVELMSWTEAGARWSVLWNETASRVQVRVPGFCLARVVELLQDAAAWGPFAEAIQPRLVGYRAPDRDERVLEVVSHAASAYLASILAQHGMVWRTSPGEPLRLEREGEPVDPTALVEGVLEGRLGVEAVEGLCARLAVARDAAWSVREKEREEALAPLVPVKVEHAGDAVTVCAPFSRLGLPHCCAVCGGDLCRHVETRFHVGGVLNDDGDITIEVPVCQTHALQPHKAFKVRRYEQASDLITLEVPSLEYARLIQRSNA
ncbi:M48 family metallopeptidase [Cystobacter ferrugineus]|uniref:M48 family metallopeptidase n=1 Tax=Cystobacter ferrugineus TaxID=83449 RepID=UPI0009036C47|nr:M48 family metallopeptidase [Cystobacter ferrugineus]